MTCCLKWNICASHFAWREITGKISGSPHIAYIFQNPMQSLNPVMRVGKQIAEGLRASKKAAAPRGRAEEERVASLLESVGLPRATIRKFPCELSGGQQQRVMIAMALAQDPDLLIADEPTTALDVTTQKEVLDLVNRVADEHKTAVLLITHNLGLVAQYSKYVNVMYAGEIIERGTVPEVLGSPMHPYTQGLLAAVPRLDLPKDSPLVGIPGTVPPPTDWPSGCANVRASSLNLVWRRSGDINWRWRPLAVFAEGATTCCVGKNKKIQFPPCALQQILVYYEPKHKG